MPFNFSVSFFCGPAELRKTFTPGNIQIWVKNSKLVLSDRKPRATSSAPGGSPPRPQGAAGDRGLCHLRAQDEEGLTRLPSPPAACCPPCLLPPSCPEGPSQRQGTDRGLHRFSSQCHPPGSPACPQLLLLLRDPSVPRAGAPFLLLSETHTHRIRSYQLLITPPSGLQCDGQGQ